MITRFKTKRDFLNEIYKYKYETIRIGTSFNSILEIYVNKDNRELLGYCFLPLKDPITNNPRLPVICKEIILTEIFRDNTEVHEDISNLIKKGDIKALITIT